MEMDFQLKVIGEIRSTISDAESAPKQGQEGAPDAWLELKPRFIDGLFGLSVGSDIVIITWLHQSKRDTLQTHPRGDQSRVLTGVFATRSPNRPNPLGLHLVTVRKIEGTRLLVGPIEVFNGTPVVDIKIALRKMQDF